MFLVRHARRFFADLINELKGACFAYTKWIFRKRCWDRAGRTTHRIRWYLTDIAKSDVLPTVVDVVSATIRAKIIHGDKDGLGDRRLVPRVGMTWRCRGA